MYNEGHMQSALNTLWKHNFVPDIPSFRGTFREGRYDAWTDDAGLIMCTWPNGGLRENFRKHRPYRYFNECMSGFEYQAAARMVAEGTPELVKQGLAITRASMTAIVVPQTGRRDVPGIETRHPNDQSHRLDRRWHCQAPGDFVLRDNAEDTKLWLDVMTPRRRRSF